jgi:transcriptional regulator with XRE-family HTH domain
MKKRGRPSIPKTTVAALRLCIGHTQQEFAALCGVSIETISSIEVKRLALSRSLASRISALTGVSAAWLLTGNLDQPPITPNGTPYSKQEFVRYRLRFDRPRTEIDAYPIGAHIVALLGVAEAAARIRMAGVFCFELSDFIREWRNRCGTSTPGSIPGIGLEELRKTLLFEQGAGSADLFTSLDRVLAERRDVRSQKPQA